MLPLLPSTQITRSDQLLATEVDGETVLMHVDQGRYYSLARTAHVIWELLEQPKTLAELCRALQTRFAGPAQAIESDTCRFVEQMAAERLVTLS